MALGDPAAAVPGSAATIWVVARQRPRRVRVRWRRLFIALIVCYLVVVAVAQEVRIARLAWQARQLEAAIAAAEARQAAYLEELHYLQSDAYVEYVAREQLGLVRPGELPYRFILPTAPSDEASAGTR